MDSKIFTKRPEELLGPLNEVMQKYAKILFLKGNLEIFNKGPRVSVVGSRNPSKQGKEDTIKIVETLIQNNVTIVSGLAKGIDTVAHITTIQKGGHTIAVLGTPLNKHYPVENYHLQEKIADQNLIISQFPEGYPIKKENFPLRNRTMALISHATIITEAGETSGTIHQGWEALRLGRPLFIMNELVNKLSWAKKMVEYGAIPISRSDVNIVLDIIPAHGLRPIYVAITT